MIIDSHHHFWDYDPGQYGWIGEGMEVLKQDFGPSELNEVLGQAGVDGVISVQARTSELENKFLLEHGSRHDFVKGVVGWLDFTADGLEPKLEAYARNPLLKGFRHVLQGEPDERYMLREDFNAGIGKLHGFGFSYDVLIRQNHLPHVPAFVDQHPGLTFIVDHIAKPRIESNSPPEAWVKGMKEVARREQVFCKVSGMVTEVVPGVSWSAELLRPYFEVVLEAFGADRLLFGSDWPVCLLQAEYLAWKQTVEGFVRELSDAEQKAIWGENAMRAYSLDGGGD